MLHHVQRLNRKRKKQKLPVTIPSAVLMKINSFFVLYKTNKYPHIPQFSDRAPALQGVALVSAGMCSKPKIITCVTFCGNCELLLYLLFSVLRVRGAKPPDLSFCSSGVDQLTTPTCLSHQQYDTFAGPELCRLTFSDPSKGIYDPSWQHRGGFTKSNCYFMA